jgi:hypothetical protein
MNVSGGYVEKEMFFFQDRISRVVRFISICDLFTDSPRRLIPCSSADAEEKAKQETSVKQMASRTEQMETKCSSETSVDFQRTKQRYIPGDITLHQNLKSNRNVTALVNLLSGRSEKLATDHTSIVRNATFV